MGKDLEKIFLSRQAVASVHAIWASTAGRILVSQKSMMTQSGRYCLGERPRILCTPFFHSQGSMLANLVRNGRGGMGMDIRMSGVRPASGGVIEKM